MHRLALIAVLAAAAAAAAADPFTYPDTPAGRRAAALVEAINSGDEDALRWFDANHRAESARQATPIDALLPAIMRTRAMTGPLEPRSIDRSEDLELVILVQLTRLGRWAMLTIECEEQPPHGVVTFQLAPRESRIERISYDDWGSLQELLVQAREDGGFPALAAAVVRGDRIEAAAVGVRVEGEADPVRPDDCFHIGSVTKSMTATVIGRLVEQGDLEWDRTLAEALPDIAMRPEYRGVTVEQLIRHRGGIPAHLTYDDAEMTRLLALPGDATAQRAAYAAEVLMEAPEVAPGTSTNYSNAGYAVAALVAERASGKSWRELLREVIFEPLGMSTAGTGWPASPEHPAEPRGHRGTEPQPLDDPYVLGAFIAPAGDVHCSAADLARYARMHLRGLNGHDGAVSAATVRRLHTSPEPADKADRYAGGWVLRRTGDGSTVHWHNGSAGTFYSLVAIWPQSDDAVVVLMNCANATSELIAWKVAEAIHDRSLAGAAEPVQ